MVTLKSRKTYLSPVEFRIFAHRGSTEGGAEENSLEAFQFAVDSGVRYLETDIRTTLDGHAVLFHDATLLRLIGDNSKLAKLPLHSLQSKLHDAGLSRALTISEALERFPVSRFNIDLKDEKAVDPVVDAIKATKSENRVLISSFSRKRRMKALAKLPAVATSADSQTFLTIWLSWRFGIIGLSKRLLSSVDALQIPTHYGSLRFDDSRFITFCVNSGVEVHFWTINETSEVARLRGLGASGIVTDKGKLIVEFLRER